MAELPDVRGWQEVRCEGYFKGYRSAGICGQLLLRVAPGTTGGWEMKCHRCRARRIIRADAQSYKTIQVP